METMHHVRSGSALLLCMILTVTMATLFAAVHMRLQFFVQTVYEREQHLKLRAATHALMVCAVQKGCAQLSALLARTNQVEHVNWPIDKDVTAQGTVVYQRHDMPDGLRLSVDVKVIHKERTCAMHATIRAVYDAHSKLLSHYTIADWSVGQ